MVEGSPASISPLRRPHWPTRVFSKDKDRIKTLARRLEVWTNLSQVLSGYKLYDESICIDEDIVRKLGFSGDAAQNAFLMRLALGLSCALQGSLQPTRDTASQLVYAVQEAEAVLERKPRSRVQPALDPFSVTVPYTPDVLQALTSCAAVSQAVYQAMLGLPETAVAQVDRFLSRILALAVGQVDRLARMILEHEIMSALK